MWGVALFIGFKITVLPLVEGVYNYIASANEISQLKTQYTTMQKQIDAMRKKRDYMKTPSYVEERAHEIGLVKPEESQMVVMEGVSDGTKIIKKNARKNVEIGN
jgi:cell division protein FtsB